MRGTFLRVALFVWEAEALLLGLHERELGSVPATGKRAAGTDAVGMGRDGSV